MKRVFLKYLLAPCLFLGAINAGATVRNAVIKGRIISFNEKYVSVKNTESMVETKVPRNLFVENIQSGERVRLELTDSQFEEVQKLNQKK